MPESVQTGGVMQFDYSKSKRKELNDDEKLEIKKGYSEFRERRKKEKRNKIIFIILIVLVALIIGYFAFLR